MKVSTVQYAKTIYESTENKSQKEINGVISNFVKQIAKNNDLKIADKIIEKFNEIYNRENGIVEAEIISREELSNELRTKVRTYVSNKYKAKEVVLENKVDESIKGGVVIRVGDEILDSSINRQLINLSKLLKT